MERGAYAVPEPVGRSSQTNTTGADRDREDFSNDDPSDGAPCYREERDVEADECDHG